jgi:alpha-tubulin suppressor-like RCC1 family protein
MLGNLLPDVRRGFALLNWSKPWRPRRQYTDTRPGHNASGQVVSVSAGERSSCAAVLHGGVKCWGHGYFGQLGGGGSTTRYLPLDMGNNLPWVNLGTGVMVAHVETGYDFNCALLTNGDVKCWGRGGRIGSDDASSAGTFDSEMGDNLLPINLGVGRTATQLAVGYAHTCAILDSGALKCWGKEQNGRLGYGLPASSTTVTGDVDRAYSCSHATYSSTVRP